MEFWFRLRLFLQLHFKAIFAKKTPILPSVVAHKSANQTLNPSQIQLNTKELLSLQRRRVLLDWHDNFESQLNSVAVDGFWSFVGQTRNQTQQLGLARKVFAQPAAEALGPAFRNQVMYPLSEKVREANARLREITSTWSDQLNLQPSLRTIEVDSKLTILRNVGFRSRHQESIIEKLELLIFAKGGILDAQIAQSLTVLEDLLKKLDGLR